MSATQKMTEYKTYHELVESLAASAKRNSEPEWLSALRRKAYERFKELGFPTRKSEAWKYLHLEPLLKTPFASAPRPALTSKDLQKLKATFLPENTNRLVFVNGYYVKELSSPSPLSSPPLKGRGRGEGAKALSNLPNAVLGDLGGVLAANGNQTLKSHLGQGIEKEPNPFTAINAFSFQDGIYLYLPKDARIENPLEIIFATANPSATPFVSCPRIFVFLEEGASVEVVLQHVSLTPSASFVNSAAEIYLGKKTKLSWTEVHFEESGANQFSNTHCSLQKNSSFQRTAFFQGEAVARDEVNVALEDERASCELAGLAVLSEGSQVFHHVKVTHAAGLCSSRQVYKNILADRAQAEYNSLVRVLKGASRSNAEQLDENLLLSDGARAYSRPQLRIDNDDVQCNHGATTGQLEKDELFYLQSRGLKKSLARQILIFGFAKEVLEGIPLLDLRRRLEQGVQEKIQAMVKDQG